MKVKNRGRLLVGIISLSYLLLILVPFEGNAEIPLTTTYQGYLTDSGGNPVDGSVNMTLKVYDVASGGSPLWTETHTGVNVNDGVFNLIVGEITPLSPYMLDGPGYLGITVGSDSEMTPRQRFTSTLFAFRAGVADDGQNVQVPFELSGSIPTPGSIIKGTNNGDGRGLYGASNFGEAVYGVSTSTTNYGYIGGETYAVYGHNTNGNYGFIGGPSNSVEGHTSFGAGVYGKNNTSNNYGTLGDSHAAVHGESGGGSNFAGYFIGNVNIDGNTHVTGELNVDGLLTKGSGSFKIDHPLDPENRFLYHSFVESPDMKNVYDGVVLLDENGEAWVALPDWFEALNRDFRYQLTCVGGFAPVYIAEEISNSRFKISGGDPGMKVSWQVTGIRQDPYAIAHRVPVEVEKSEHERGHYLYPEAYGQIP